MQTLFSSQPGVVGVVADDAHLPVSVWLARADGTAFGPGPAVRAVVTSFDLDAQGSVQVQRSLRQKLNVVVVGGEGPTEVRLGGLWFAAVCPGASGGTGLERTLTFYESARVSTSGQVVKVVLGGVALTGVLRRLTARLADPDTGVGEFAFHLTCFPRGVLAAGPTPFSPLGAPAGVSALVGGVGAASADVAAALQAAAANAIAGASLVGAAA